MIGTLESGIDIRQGTNVGPGKFVKKSKHRAFNKRKAGTKCAKICYKKHIKLENICRPWKKNPKFNKRRAFNTAVGPGKRFKINKRRNYLYSGL